MRSFSKALKILESALGPFPWQTFNLRFCGFSLSNRCFSRNDLPVNHSHLSVFLKRTDYFATLRMRHLRACIRVCVCVRVQGRASVRATFVHMYVRLCMRACQTFNVRSTNLSLVGDHCRSSLHAAHVNILADNTCWAPLSVTFIPTAFSLYVAKWHLLATLLSFKLSLACYLLA